MSPIYQSEKVSLKISFLITLWLAANKLNNCFIVDVFVLKFFKEQKKNLKVMSLFVGVRFGQKTFFFWPDGILRESTTTSLQSFLVYVDIFLPILVIQFTTLKKGPKRADIECTMA